MSITIDHNLEDIIFRLERGPGRVNRAHIAAVNDVAFEARVDFQDAMREEFHQVTPYMIRSVWVQKATESNPTATVWPRDMGGKGVDPAKILLAQVKGGPRRNKRFEVALQRAGILPSGMAAVPAGGMDPAHIDAYGNVKGSFIVRLLSYLQAFSEQGYSANMKDKRRASIEKRGKSERGYATINGVAYFVSRGRGEFNGKQQHLAAGIWAKSGIHGSNVRPVFLWTKRMPAYTRTINLQRIGETAVRSRYARAFSQRLGKVLR